MSDIPEKIFLNFGDEDPEHMGLMSWGDVEWCDESIGEYDVEYIRYDLYRKREKELKDEIKYLIVENSTKIKE